MINEKLHLPTDAAPAAMKGSVGLKMEHVWKRFGPVVAVRDVSFSARFGEVHALLGENGAGKSTLMGIASGNLKPDEGTIEICGESMGHVTASQAQRLGLALVHQHPAVLPDLTVAENMFLAVPPALRTGDSDPDAWVRTQLARVGCTAHPFARMSEIDIGQSQLIELAKALAIEPRRLILDEPTAALTSDLVDLLFENVRAAAARGAAVIYISHRLKEIRQIADTVTVVRDGEVKGSAAIHDVTDDQILNLIVGRTVTKTFPAKSSGLLKGGATLRIEGFSGHEFFDITASARGGEIVGIAGISGNGQSELLRAMAGLEPAHGKMSIDNSPVGLGNPRSARKAGIIYLSPDRQHEGVFPSLSVRENGTISALFRFARFGVVDRSLECQHMEEQRANLNIRTASLDQKITTLSGGNQQKTIISRALLAQASVVLAEEPTAGVDVGARAEIYRILRDVAAQGTIVIIVSSDLVELEGLCDRVLVISRGHVVGELQGEDISEAAIGRSMISATSHRKLDAGHDGAVVRPLWRRIADSDYVPSLVLAILIAGLALYSWGHNARFLSPFNVEKILFLSAGLAFVSFGQLFTVLVGRIDLSVGPLVGLSLVIASFFLNEGAGLEMTVLGLIAVFGAACLVGLVNGALVRFGNFTAVAATLGIYIIIQGISVLLRPYPDGSIGAGFMTAVKATAGSIPIMFGVAVAVGVIMEIVLRRSRWGRSLRAVGSNERAAEHIGIKTGWVVISAFVACSMMTAAGGIMVVAQLGIGDANQGIEYTLGSIAAVALGGASLLGGRGSFIGVLLGAVLIQEVNSSMGFLGLSQAWQYWFIGLLTLFAVAAYSQSKRIH